MKNISKKAEVICFSLRKKNSFPHTSKEEFNFICCYNNNQMVPTSPFLNWEWLNFKMNVCLKKKRLFLHCLYAFVCSPLHCHLHSVSTDSLWMTFLNMLTCDSLTRRHSCLCSEHHSAQYCCCSLILGPGSKDLH